MAGILDSWLSPLGQQVVDPNGQVSGMLPSEAARLRAEEEERRRLMMLKAQQEGAIGAAAAVQPQAAASWNPFRLLFGDPASGQGGVLGK